MDSCRWSSRGSLDEEESEEEGREEEEEGRSHSVDGRRSMGVVGAGREA